MGRPAILTPRRAISLQQRLEFHLLNKESISPPLPSRPCTGHGALRIRRGLVAQHTPSRPGRNDLSGETISFDVLYTVHWVMLTGVHLGMAESRLAEILRWDHCFCLLER